VLELAILGLLKEQELHGYELKRRLTHTLGLLSSVSFGSLYPALSRLEAAGAVQAVDTPEAAPPIPATGSLSGELAAFRARRGAARGGRGKKVYRVTPRGEELFDELLAADTQSSEDERQFRLRLAFARYLPPEARLGLLERRRALLVERLAQARAAVREGRDRLDAYTRSLVEHSTESTERDISWLDRLIAAERTQQRRSRRTGPRRRPRPRAPGTAGTSTTTGAAAAATSAAPAPPAFPSKPAEAAISSSAAATASPREDFNR
jgi:DNA-binding PadR family transcriptional regulator